MIEFSVNDPFPLYSLDQYSYAEAKYHSEQVDQWLGLMSQEHQIAAREGQQNWKDLPLQTLMTPYVEIRSILALLQPKAGELLIDLGCAYGRMAHVMGRHHPETHKHLLI